jgi:hypothetical protein
MVCLLLVCVVRRGAVQTFGYWAHTSVPVRLYFHRYLGHPRQVTTSPHSRTIYIVSREGIIHTNTLMYYKYINAFVYISTDWPPMRPSGSDPRDVPVVAVIVLVSNAAALLRLRLSVLLMVAPLVAVP